MLGAFIKTLVRAVLISSAGIIPALGASGPSDQAFWLTTTSSKGPGSVQAIAGVSHDDQLLLSIEGALAHLTINRPIDG